MEQILSDLIKNINQATYEQITLAEESIKKLRHENKQGKEVHAKLAFLSEEKYQVLLHVLKTIERKKAHTLITPTGSNGISKERMIIAKKKSQQASFRTQNTQKNHDNQTLQDINYSSLSCDEIDLLKL